MIIIIVDDDAIVAASMKTILIEEEDVTIPEIGFNGDDAIQLYEKYQPDILLMDIQMKKKSGLEAAEIILKKDPAAKIIFLTTFLEDEYIKDAINIGAKGYILKQDYQGVLPSIRAVYSGQNVFGNQIINMLPKLMMDYHKNTYEHKGITEKEFEIIELVAQGLSNKEIAKKLCLSDGTVRNYISVILEKLELRDRTQLAVFYYKH